MTDFDTKCESDEDLPMKFTQIPIVRNTATTGHKLQGASVDNVFIFDWHSRNRNWAYVALSRVREKKGLFTRHEIKSNLSSYEVPEDYLFWQKKKEYMKAKFEPVEKYTEVLKLQRNARMDL
jgi:hypothetical protein